MDMKISPGELAKQLGRFASVIGRYKRDKMTSSIEAAKNLAKILSITVGYLLGETEDRELLKDPSMMKRLNDIAKFPEQDKRCILYALDAMINNVKLKKLFNKKARTKSGFCLFPIHNLKVIY